MTFYWFFPGDFTNSCHGIKDYSIIFQKRSAKNGIFFEKCKSFLKRHLGCSFSHTQGWCNIPCFDLYYLFILNYNTLSNSYIFFVNLCENLPVLNFSQRFTKNFNEFHQERKSTYDQNQSQSCLTFRISSTAKSFFLAISTSSW